MLPQGTQCFIVLSMEQTIGALGPVPRFVDLRKSAYRISEGAPSRASRHRVETGLAGSDLRPCAQGPAGICTGKFGCAYKLKPDFNCNWCLNYAVRPADIRLINRRSRGTNRLASSPSASHIASIFPEHSGASSFKSAHENPDFVKCGGTQPPRSWLRQCPS
jgi:hypothetical protein